MRWRAAVAGVGARVGVGLGGVHEGRGVGVGARAPEGAPEAAPRVGVAVAVDACQLSWAQAREGLVKRHAAHWTRQEAAQDGMSEAPARAMRTESARRRRG